MRIRFGLRPVLCVIALACLYFNPCSTGLAQGTTAFTYQGQLRDSGTNANGSYAMTYKLYNAASAGTQVGGTVSVPGQSLVNGLFSVNLDFGGGAFDGNARWLEITAQSGAGASETLMPRVQVLSAPYALFAGLAGTVTNGAIMNAQLAGNAVDTANIQNNAVTDAKVVSVSGSKISGPVSSATSLTNGIWNSSVATYQTFPNIFGFYANNSLVMGLSTSGVFASGGISANQFSFNSGGSISSDGQRGIQLDGSISASNLVLHGSSVQFPGQSGAAITVSNNGDFIFDDNVRITALGKISLPSPGGNRILSGDIGGLTVNSAVSATAFNTTSDRNVKERFNAINSREILDRVANLPISSWNFKQDAAARHIGPMAQDFYAAFNVGPDDKHIATVDADGVALAAIQGLHEIAKEKDAEIAALKQRLTDLEQAVSALARQKGVTP